MKRVKTLTLFFNWAINSFIFAFFSNFQSLPVNFPLIPITSLSIPLALLSNDKHCRRKKKYIYKANRFHRMQLYQGTHPSVKETYHLHITNPPCCKWHYLMTTFNHPHCKMTLKSVVFCFGISIFFFFFSCQCCLVSG